MRKKLLILICIILIPTLAWAQKVERPSTPEEYWVFIRTTVHDLETNEPVYSKFKLETSEDSSVVCQGETEYDRWISDDGPHEAERILLIIPDFTKKYVLEVMSKNYKTQKVDLDFTEQFTLQTPLEERDIRITPILLTKKD